MLWPQAMNGKIMIFFYPQEWVAEKNILWCCNWPLSYWEKYGGALVQNGTQRVQGIPLYYAWPCLLYRQLFVGNETTMDYYHRAHVWAEYWDNCAWEKICQDIAGKFVCVCHLLQANYGICHSEKNWTNSSPPTLICINFSWSDTYALWRKKKTQCLK